MSSQPIERGQLRIFYEKSLVGQLIAGKKFIVIDVDHEFNGLDGMPSFWNCLLFDGSQRIYSSKAIELYSTAIDETG